MEARSPRRAIAPLPLNVQAQIQSSIAITSLNDVVLELVKNSLDGEAADIKVHVNRGKGACEVEDDGSGIPAADFDSDGGLGRPFHSSKYPHAAPTYGSQGQFLASLASLSLVSITSCHKEEDEGRTLILHRTRVIGRYGVVDPGTAFRNHRHGTTVAVHDLFGNLPVRVKDRALRARDSNAQSKDFDELRRRIYAVVLAYAQPITISIVDNEQVENSDLRIRLSSVNEHRHQPMDRMQKSFDLTRIVSLFKQIYRGLSDEGGQWTMASGRTMRLCARAAIHLKPVPTKRLQFISLGQLPLDSHDYHSIIFDDINRIFNRSTFATRDEESELEEAGIARRAGDRSLRNDSLTSKRIRDQTRGPKCHPMFYIRIDFLNDGSESSTTNDSFRFVRSQRAVEDILELLRPMLWQCLEQFGFQPRNIRRERGPKAESRHSRPDSGEGLFVGQRDNRDSPVHANRPGHSQPLAEPAEASKRPIGAFENWTRIKSSSRDCLKELGLPHPQLSDLTCLEKLPACMSNYNVDEDGLSDSTGTLSAPEGEASSLSVQATGSKEDQTHAFVDNGLQKDTPDEILTWKDPATGKLVYINSRTGHGVPDHSHQSSDLDTDKLVLRPAVATRRSIRLARGTDPVGNAQNLDNVWVNDVLKDWRNPVFKEAETPIPLISQEFEESHQCHSRKSTHRNFAYSNGSTFGRLSRTALTTADVIGQVDDKFILISVDVNPTTRKEDGEKQLVLVDQHAADERCRVEELLRQLCHPAATELISGLNSRLSKPLGFEITCEEARMFEGAQAFFASWNIFYELRKKRSDSHCRPSRPTSAASTSTISTTTTTTTIISDTHELLLINRLPTVIAERCRLEPQILIDMLRTEVWARHDSDATIPPSSVSSSSSSSSSLKRNSTNPNAWVHRIPTLPRSLLDMLNSRACRSAVMFNDKLSVDECKALIHRLASCHFPFLCAHGRRSCACVGTFVRRGDGGSEQRNQQTGGSVDDDDEKGSSAPGFLEAFRHWETERE